MEYTKQTTAERNYKILAFLFASGQWENIREIGRKTGTTENPTRLKESLNTLVKRNIIDSWEALSEDKQKEARRSQNKEINRKNNYKITIKGGEKLRKIRDDCLDPDTRIILRMKRAKNEHD